MRRLAALLVLAASACADGGVVIEVTPTDPNVDSVRLYIGGYDRTEDAMLELPIGSTANGVTRTTVPGVTYFPRDANNELDTKAIKKSGETVKFVLVRGGETDLGAIIAVGYAGKQISEVATLFDVHLPSTHFDQYSLKLARPVQPPVAWSPTYPISPIDATCIGITDPQTKDPYAVSYIVSPDDPDCDGLAKDDPKECNNNAWFGKRPASLDEITCIVPEPVTQSCFLGGPECQDGMPPQAGQCAPTNFCVPKTVCSVCAGNLSCAEDITMNPTLPPGARAFGIDCLERVQNGDLCEDELVLSMGPIDGLDCTDAAIGDAKHPFSDHIDLGNQQITLKRDPGCQLRLVVKGKAPSGNIAQLGLMIAVSLDNGRGIAVPILLRVDKAATACSGQPVSCTFDSSTVGSEILDCATPWSKPAIEPGLTPTSATNVRSPTLTADELDIWFVVDSSQIWHSARASKIAAWSAPLVDAPLSMAGLGQSTTAARVSPDGLTMYVSGLRNVTVGGGDLYLATRMSRAEAWSQLSPVQGQVNTARDELGGSIDGAGHLLGYSADADSGGTVHSRLMLASRSTMTGGWGTGIALPGTGSLTDDYNPHLTADQKSIYFSSNALDTMGHELFVMGRPLATGTFGPPRHLDALSSPKDEDDPWVSNDQKTIYFASNRGSGNYRIYRATR